MQRQNYLKRKLESGKVVLGAWSIIPNPVVTDIIASTGLDFVVIDSEHGPITFETAQQMAMACESRSVSPVMRVAATEQGDILKALDIGVHAIQVPNIVSHDDVARVVKFSKYPPIGSRGFSPFTRAGDYSMENATSHTKTANDNTMVAIHIEGEDAFAHIDRILETEHLDIVFIGIFDLSKSLGIPGQVDDIRVVRRLRELTARINEAGKYPGTVVGNGEKLREAVEIGVKYITYSVDCEILRAGFSGARRAFDKIIC
jgi:4-hydroxy-2-oxoheptanedioate aldolase